MRYLVLLFTLILCVNTHAQVWEDDFSSPEHSYEHWSGDWASFAINKNQQLQSQSPESNEAFLFHESYCAIQAQWQCWVRISGSCSAYNLIRWYVTLDGEIPYANGYFIQIGGANKNITLYQQNNDEIVKIIENEERKKILDADASYLHLRLTRSNDGVFHLYSWVENKDTNWIKEGQYFVPMLISNQSAICVRNSKTRGYDFYIDDISVSGIAQTDPIDNAHTNQHDQQYNILLHQDCISPNGDGWEDQACISYTLPNDDYLATVGIFTPNGILVKQIYNATPIDANGTFCWDATNQRETRVDIGVYVLILEFKNKKTHSVIRKHYTVAVI